MTGSHLLCWVGNMGSKKRARSKAAKSERKDEIIAAAETLLRQLGYDAMTMQAVAMEAGLGKGTLALYIYFQYHLIRYIYIFLVVKDWS